MMAPTPWSYVHSWRCTGCGICCREFEVVLKLDEWLNLIRTYGVGVTKAGLNKFYLEKSSDGSCIFLRMFNGVHFCGLQNMKPASCKLWPFKILDQPRYGKSQQALYDYRGRRFYIYIDPLCPEIRWGKPPLKMVDNVIPEFIDIALGLRDKQFYSTSSTLYDLYPKPRRDYRLI